MKLFYLLLPLIDKTSVDGGFLTRVNYRNAFTTFALVAALPLISASEHDPLPNAQHIFNAIQSSMRQWGSSLNHNGMSFFLATVPIGIHLHHGSPRSVPVKGMEWLAFEPEHALRFAWDVCDCDNPDQQCSEPMSLKWSWPHHHHQPPHASVSSTIQQEHQLQNTLKPPPRMPPNFCFGPGFIHTYTPTRPLRLLYIDGQSAAKSRNGTLDSQTYILLHDLPARSFRDDYGRATDLCTLARTSWEGGVDGFIRMEHGFEIILCDFESLKVVSVLGAEHSTLSPGWELREVWKLFADSLNFWQAISSRYWGIGGERASVHYDEFVTAWNYDIDLFPASSSVPRLTEISNETAERIFQDVTRLILSHSQSPASSPSRAFEEEEEERKGKGLNWQAITTLLTTHYTRPLLHLSAPSTIDILNSTTLSYAIERLLSPYISHGSRNSTLEIHRCTNAFLPYQLHHNPPHEQSLAHGTFLQVARRLCSTLHSLLPHSAPELPSLEEQQRELRDLIDWLAWPEFKYCQPGCGVGEVCFTAIWPWGSQEDVENPSCKDGRSVAAIVGEWDMDLD